MLPLFSLAFSYFIPSLFPPCIDPFAHKNFQLGSLVLRGNVPCPLFSTSGNCTRLLPTVTPYDRRSLFSTAQIFAAVPPLSKKGSAEIHPQLLLPVSPSPSVMPPALLRFYPQLILPSGVPRTASAYVRFATGTEDEVSRAYVVFFGGCDVCFSSHPP